MISLKEFINYFIKFTGLKFIIVILLSGLLIFFQLMLIASITPLIDQVLQNETSNILTLKTEEFLNMLNMELNFVNAGIIFITLSIITACLKTLVSFFIFKIKYICLSNIINDCIDKFLNAGQDFYSEIDKGAVINSFQSELSKIGNSFITISNLIVSVLQIFFILLIPLLIFPELTIYFIIISILIFSPIFLLKKKFTTLGTNFTETGNRFTKSIVEITNLMIEIICFGEKNKALRYTDESFKKHSKVAVLFQTIGEFISSITFPFIILAMFISIYFFSINLSNLSSLALVMFAFQRLIQPITHVLNGRMSLNVYSAAFNQLNNLINKADLYKEKRGKKIYKGINKAINLKDINFSHKSREVVFNKLNCEIKNRSLTAIVGGSGKGKTTFIKLLLGLYKNYSGKIYYDDDNINDIDQISLRKKIGYVPQESNFFDGSIIENLKWSKTNITKNEVMELLSSLNLENFINSLPSKLDTNIGEMGNKISGGQKQRLSLARALIRNPEILILDEPTSSLDDHSEKVIKETILTLKKNMTIILISHKKHMIEMSDIIYEIKNNRLERLK